MVALIKSSLSRDSKRPRTGSQKKENIGEIHILTEDFSKRFLKICGLSIKGGESTKKDQTYYFAVEAKSYLYCTSDLA